MENTWEDKCSDKQDIEEQMQSYKYLLGEMGLQILTSILRGVFTESTIMMISGVPMACVRGRLPVLINLGLVIELQGEYHITTKGNEFLQMIGEV